MDKATRNVIERATQQARKLLDEDFSAQLEGTYDVLRTGIVAPKAGAHLSAHQQFLRDKVVATLEHKCSAETPPMEAITDYVRDAAFTALNRFVALKMLEARQLVQECITKGEQSAGYREFCGMAPGVALLPDAAGYRLYVESLFDEFSTEIKVLFDRRDAASVLWPKRQTFEALLTILNGPDLAGVWGEDETIGWVYQFFNSGEERKKMRDESQAPRNSRELAVRNQFFTPRYVVQFLVDNTLGRLWSEMTAGQTDLTKICEYLVCSADAPAGTRPRSDPRDLRILDPACGSGHFLLYSFDLLLTIYEEAWTTERGPKSQATGRSLREDYADLTELRRSVPGLIVELNLHGVDIDPRCAQIAALALWLRAQRAWKDVGIAASDRPRIYRTHIVVAEPIPGDAVLVDEFAARLDPPLLRDLFKKMVGESRFAGELGTLLRIEDGIAAELRRAREHFVKQRQTTGFLPGMEPVARQGFLDLSGIDDDLFFHEAETRIVEALRLFAEAASGSANVRRRLFAGDAAQGVALIDLVRTKFDVVLMNPPFGACSLGGKREFEKSYPRTKNDVYAAFVERGIQLLRPHGLLGAITSRTGFFLSSFQKWREEILLKEAPPVAFADLGLGVMDAALVEAAAYCLEKDRIGTRAVMLRVLEEVHDKEGALCRAMRSPSGASNLERFEVDPETFREIPGFPFAYWISADVRNLFSALPALGSEGRIVKLGASTKNDGRYLRLWWEIEPQGNESEPRWRPLAKGGAYAPFYADLQLMIGWWRGAREIEAELLQKFPYLGSNADFVLHRRDPHLQPGLTWTRRTKSPLSLRVLPRECVFADKGPSIFWDGELHEEGLLALLAVGASKIFQHLVEVQLSAAEPTGRGGVARSYEVGIIQSTPLPPLTPHTIAVLADLSKQAWALKRGADIRNENSHAFVMPAVLQVDGRTLRKRAEAWAETCRSTEAKLVDIQVAIDDICFTAYGFDQITRRKVEDGFGAISEKLSTCLDVSEPDNDADDEAETESIVDEIGLATELGSWAIGVAFGRFDLRSKRETQPEARDPEPFDPLPACSPAMLTGPDGLPMATSPVGYTIAFPENGILIDDPGHARNVAAVARSVFDEVFGEAAEVWWNDVAALLNPKDHDLRAWVATSFFEHHLKRYSKSRRKAPIFWQLAVPSNRYSVWLYAHRLTRDSCFQIQNDFVIPKLSHEERQLTNLVESAAGNPSAMERKEIAEQEAFVTELRAFLDEVKRVAPLWNPELVDGVVLTMAPLWRLVPQNKAWQKELKSKWDELAGGKCDWAHLAMHLWPERVVPKCATDRSLAIAHGLEDVFWAEARDGKWNPRSTHARSIGELVDERTSVAVKAALRELTEASAPSSAKAKARRSSS